jgi:hypothetical protein
MGRPLVEAIDALIRHTCFLGLACFRFKCQYAVRKISLITKETRGKRNENNHFDFTTGPL